MPARKKGRWMPPAGPAEHDSCSCRSRKGTAPPPVNPVAHMRASRRKGIIASDYTIIGRGKLPQIEGGLALGGQPGEGGLAEHLEVGAAHLLPALVDGAGRAVEALGV